MKSTSERLVMAGAAICAVLVVTAIAFLMVTEQKRSEALARMKMPAVLTQQFAANSLPAMAAEQDGPDGAAKAPDKAGESIAAFTALFPRVAALVNDDRWKTSYNFVFLKKPRNQWSPEELADAKSFSRAAQDLIIEIRRLAELGGPAVALDYSQGPAMELSHLAPLRECARLLTIDAKVQAQQGNYSEAVEDIVVGFKLGNVIKDEPITLSQLVRIAMDGIAYDCVQEALPPNRLAPGLARRVIESAGRAYAHQNFAEAFAGEGMSGLVSFEHIREGTSRGLNPFMVGPNSRPGDGLFEAVYNSMIGRPWLNMDETAYCEAMMRIKEAAQLPYDQARPVMEQIEQNVESLPRTRLLTHLLLPSLPRAIEAQARDEAMLALVQVGLSLEMYHAQNGTYPVSLDAIAPTLGGRVPVDPFTGQPLRYRPSGQSFILYSVGANLVDDGGQPGYRDDGQLDYRTGDIVWRAQPKNANKS